MSKDPRISPVFQPSYSYGESLGMMLVLAHVYSYIHMYMYMYVRVHVVCAIYRIHKCTVGLAV